MPGPRGRAQPYPNKCRRATAHRQSVDLPPQAPDDRSPGSCQVYDITSTRDNATHTHPAKGNLGDYVPSRISDRRYDRSANDPVPRYKDRQGNARNPEADHLTV